MQTERLVLRPIRQADAEPLHTVYSDPCVMRYVPGGPLGRAGTAARVRSAVEHQLTYGFSKWAVILADGGEVIGDCGIQYLEDGPAIELGFHIRRSHWGDGTHPPFPSPRPPVSRTRHDGFAGDADRPVHRSLGSRGGRVAIRGGGRDRRA